MLSWRPAKQRGRLKRPEDAKGRHQRIRDRRSSCGSHPVLLESVQEVGGCPGENPSLKGAFY